MSWTECERQTITEKIYAGLIGMDAGMRLGAPVENPYWTYERLREQYGDIRGYLRVHKNHTADDDVNGPILLVRALTDRLRAYREASAGSEKQEAACAESMDVLTPEMAGEAWLNYTRFGRGMFWWGGEDVSTEHRAYMNLRRGLRPPVSGSREQNGKTASEQIGGQIFSDTWGLICPGNPERAAAYARTAASVSHDGNGLHGAAFIAAAVAAAFGARTVEEILEAGLQVLPTDCDYARVVRAVRAFHAAHPQEKAFRDCRDYVEKEWGHDKFPGGWHIIPNAGICITGLLYGGGELGRSIEIAVMCGFDTDCNASSIGTILGVYGGLEGVPARYREPIRDTVILSGISGYLNMVDLPSLARELSVAAENIGRCSRTELSADKRRTVSAEKQGGLTGKCEENPKRFAGAAYADGDLVFDFALPGSTHGLRLSERAAHSLRNVAGEGRNGKRCLELLIDGKRPGPVDLYFTGCFIRSDLEDERYEPVFSPRVYPGQTVSCRMRAVHVAPAEVTVTPFVTLAMCGSRLEMKPVRLQKATTPDVRDGWQEVCFRVPDLGGDQVHELGWQIDLKPDEDPWAFSRIFVDRVTVTGPMDYTVNFSVQREEFGQITPFSFHDCRGELPKIPGVQREGENRTTEDGLKEDGSTKGKETGTDSTADGKRYLRLIMDEEPTACGCQAFTGNYYQRETVAEATVRIEEGGSALLLLRGQGARRCYALGIAGGNRAVIRRYNGGVVTELASVPLASASLSSASAAKASIITCHLRAEARGEQLSLCIDDSQILAAEDERFAYGMVGFAMEAPGVTLWETLHVRGSC